MIIESGVLVALGLLFTFFKLAWRTRLNMLGRPLLMDLVVFIGLNILHWGTFSGVMVAAVGALVCSAMLSIGRKTYGYIEGDTYYPGFINVITRINK